VQFPCEDKREHYPVSGNEITLIAENKTCKIKE